MELLKHDLAAINSWCLKWHVRLNPKTNSMVVSRSRTSALGYDLTLGGAELEELKSLRFLEVTSNCKLTFETHLREIISKDARNIKVVRRA